MLMTEAVQVLARFDPGARGSSRTSDLPIGARDALQPRAAFPAIQ